MILVKRTGIEGIELQISFIVEVSFKSQVREVRVNAHVMLCVTRALLGNTTKNKYCRAFTQLRLTDCVSHSI